MVLGIILLEEKKVSLKMMKLSLILILMLKVVSLLILALRVGSVPPVIMLGFFLDLQAFQIFHFLLMYFQFNVVKDQPNQREFLANF